MSTQSNPALWRAGYRFGDHQQLNDSSTQPNSSGPANININNDVVTQPKRRSKPKFEASYLIKDNGLELIYNEFNNINFSYLNGKELSNLQLLLLKYKEWMYQLYPLNFNELTNKIEKLSGNRLIQNELERLRNKRDGVITQDNFNNFEFDDNNNENNNNILPDFTSNNNNKNNENIINNVKNINNQNNQNAKTTNIINNNVSNNINNINNNNSNNNTDNNINEELEDFDIDIETNMMQNMPGEDEDELADMLFDEF